MTPHRPRKGRFRFLRGFLALTVGLLVGVFLHYLVYRLSLPSKPFIYVAF